MEAAVVAGRVQQAHIRPRTLAGQRGVKPRDVVLSFAVLKKVIDVAGSVELHIGEGDDQSCGNAGGSCPKRDCNFNIPPTLPPPPRRAPHFSPPPCNMI